MRYRILGLVIWMMGQLTVEARAESLSLAEALQRAQSAYALQQSQLQVRIQQGRWVQTQQGLNPALNVGVEEFPSLTGQSGEFNVLWQQAWAVSGRLEKRSELARQAVHLAESGVLLKARQLRQEISQAYYAALMWQHYVSVLTDLQASAEKSRLLLLQQYRAGKILLTEYNRAQLLAEDVGLQLQSATLSWQQARTKLALFWNQADDDTLVLSEELMPSSHVFKIQELLNTHPEMELARQGVEKQRLNLALQESLRWPDITTRVGLRYLPYENNLGSLAGFIWPLPVANANQGNQQVAQEEIARAQMNQQATRVSLENRLVQARQAHTNTLSLIARYQQQVLPVASQNVELTQKAYAAGKLSYLEVLDAQRSLMVLKLGYIKVWGQYWNAITRLNYLISST